MPKKLGNGGHSQETYDPNTGKYVEDGNENKYYDNPQEDIKITFGATEWDDTWDFIFEEEEEKEEDKVEEVSNTDDDAFAQRHNIKKIQGSHSIMQDLAVVNPNYSTGERKWKENCACCAIGYEMRRRGLDVEAEETNMARKIIQTFNLSLSSWKSCRNEYNLDFSIGKYNGGYTSWVYDNVPLETAFFVNDEDEWVNWTVLGSNCKRKAEAATQIYNVCLSGGEGSRFILTLEWDKGGGHALNAEVKDGKVLFIDSQVQKLYSFDEAKKEYFSSSKPSRWCYIRVDDKKLADGNFFMRKDQKNIGIGELAYKSKQ